MSGKRISQTERAAEALVAKTIKSPGIYIVDGQHFIKALSDDLKNTKADLHKHRAWEIAQIGYNYLVHSYARRAQDKHRDLNQHLVLAKPLYINALKAAAEIEITQERENALYA